MPDRKQPTDRRPNDTTTIDLVAAEILRTPEAVEEISELRKQQQQLNRLPGNFDQYGKAFTLMWETAENIQTRTFGIVTAPRALNLAASSAQSCEQSVSGWVAHGRAVEFQPDPRKPDSESPALRLRGPSPGTITSVAQVLAVRMREASLIAAVEEVTIREIGLSETDRDYDRHESHQAALRQGVYRIRRLQKRLGRLH